MDRSELSLSKAFEDWSFGSGNVLAVVAGAVLLRIGWTLFSILGPPGLLGLLIILYVYGTALGLLVAGAAGVDFRAHGRRIAYLVLGVLGLVVIAYLILTTTHPASDAAVFAQYGADLILAGENPYAVGMAGAWNATGTSPLSVSPQVDGGHVTQYSYPSGLLVLALPARALGLTINDLTLLAGLTTLSVLVLDSPREWALAPLAVLGANNWLHVTFHGTVDVLWVLPLLLAMRAWYDERWLLAGGLLGAASAMKPQPWLILPFLAIELYQRRHWHASLSVAASASGVFTILNLPFIVANPAAWLDGVLTPVTGGSANLIHSGVGLTMLTTTGTYVLPKTWFLTVFAAAYLLAIAAHLHRTPQSPWSGWIIPLTLLFLNYRSLQSYFLFILPLAYYSVLLDTDRISDRIGHPWRASDA